MSTTEAPEAKPLLNPRDTQYLIKGFECMKTRPQFDIDYEKLAAAVGISSSKAAGNGFRAAMRKIFPDWSAKGGKAGGEPGGTATTQKSTPKKATGASKGRKRVVADEIEDESADEDSLVIASPKKVNGKKSTGRNVKKRAIENELEEEDGTEEKSSKRVKTEGQEPELSDVEEEQGKEDSADNSLPENEA